jgi:hypothetical protein
MGIDGKLKGDFAILILSPVRSPNLSFQALSPFRFGGVFPNLVKIAKKCGNCPLSSRNRHLKTEIGRAGLVLIDFTPG